MEKEIRTFKVEYPLDWTYSVEISKIRQDLDALEKLGATHVEITCDISYDSAYTTIEAVSERMETDDEFAARIEEIERKRISIEKYELEQLERLKLKYGK